LGDKLPADYQTELANILKEQDALETELETHQKTVETMRKRLTVAKTFRFPDKVALAKSKLLPTQDEAKNWLTPLLTSNAVSELVRPDSYDEFASKIGIDADLRVLAEEYACFAPPAETPPAVAGGQQAQPPVAPGNPCVAPTVAGGVYFRQPVQAKLIVQRAGEKALISENLMIPQFGRLRLLPLKSGWGEKNGLSAEFAKSGVPSKIEYKVLEAPGAKALSLGNDALAAYLSVRSEMRAEEDKKDTEAVDAQKSALEKLKREVEIAENEQKLEKLRTATPTTLEEKQAELALVNLDKQIAEARAAIRAAEAK
jgi:hypothetical protein